MKAFIGWLFSEAALVEPAAAAEVFRRIFHRRRGIKITQQSNDCSVPLCQKRA